jgi:hypothetical protein
MPFERVIEACNADTGDSWRSPRLTKVMPAASVMLLLEEPHTAAGSAQSVCLEMTWMAEA